MPTLRKVGLHPDLCGRLVVAGGSSSENDPGQQPPHHQPISTPQALLSRNPDQLRLVSSSEDSTATQSRPIPLQQAEQLRLQVATAMIKSSKTGRWLQGLRGPDQTTTNTTSVFELLPPAKIPPVSTGCPSLDRALSEQTAPAAGGVPWGTLTQFSGPPGVGKTRLALQIATSSPHRVWYIYSGTAPPVGPEMTTTMRFCGPTTSTYQLLASLAAIEEELVGADSENTDGKGTILIVDSCSGCCASSLDAASGSSLIPQVSLTLKRLTRLHNLATLLVNGTVADGTKPALGNVWNTTVPDTCVWMTERLQLLVSYRSLPTAPTITLSLKMGQDGVISDM